MGFSPKAGNQQTREMQCFVTAEQKSLSGASFDEVNQSETIVIKQRGCDDLYVLLANTEIYGFSESLVNQSDIC